VLLSAYLNVYLNPRDASGAPNGTYAEMRQQVGVSAGDDAVAQLIYADYARLIGKLRAQGLNVGILADVPELLRPVIGCRTTHDCDRAPQTANVLSSQRGARQLLARLQAQFPGLALFDPVPLLCDSRTCHSEVGGKLLYSDDNHLNENGSYFVGGQLVSWIESNYPLSPSQPPSP
jgi:hypothetical protein